MAALSRHGNKGQEEEAHIPAFAGAAGQVAMGIGECPTISSNRRGGPRG